jgi:hypothetical protein
MNGGMQRVDFVHTGLYGETAELMMNLAWMAGRDDALMCGLKICKGAANYAMMNEIKVIEVHRGTHTSSHNALKDLKSIMFRCYKFHRVRDVYRDEFGEVIIVAVHENDSFNGERDDFMNFSEIRKIENNLKQLKKVLFVPDASKVFNYKTTQTLNVSYGDELGVDIATKDIELMYKDQVEGIVRIEDFNSVLGYITGCINGKHTKNVGPMFNPMQNPIEIESRRLKIDEERRILSDFLQECERQANILFKKIIAEFSASEDSIVRDFDRRREELRRLQ